MAKKPKDRVEALEEEIQSLKKIIRNRDKTIRQLKSEIDTTHSAWSKTEFFLKEVTSGKPLSEVLENVESGRPLSLEQDSCPKCNLKFLKKMLYTGFHIVACSCGYRAKVNEEQQLRKD